mgnify:CR=1 FL=1
MPASAVRPDFSIVAVHRFIQATRDSGYRNTVSAVSELVDNSIQAEAGLIEISIDTDLSESLPLTLTLRDDGCGMDPLTLRIAMQFGGSSRFGDRSGLGRFGMGLPNASLSQAQRVDVWSWEDGSPTYQTHLDVDEIASGVVREVPRPEPTMAPDGVRPSASGTIVRWSRCDRLDNRRASTIARKLAAGLGRKFRYFLWEGGQILVNGAPVLPIDPLYVHPDSVVRGGTEFGEPLCEEFRVGDGTSTVRVRFSELPVEEWHSLTNKEKRRLGISQGAGVSIVRAGREVDYGWFLMGNKKRQNYDDWWRCEICFQPELDEQFGITHTKQQVRPSASLVEALSPHLEQLGRLLNQRARDAHRKAKVAPKPSRSEQHAAARDQQLPPLPPPAQPPSVSTMAELARIDRGLTKSPSPAASASVEYRIVEASQRDTSFFSTVHEQGRLLLVVNPEHEFFRHVYEPLQKLETPEARALLTQLELVLLASARAEAALAPQVTETLQRHRAEWSNVLATFLRA